MESKIEEFNFKTNIERKIFRFYSRVAYICMKLKEILKQNKKYDKYWLFSVSYSIQYKCLYYIFFVQNNFSCKFCYGGYFHVENKTMVTFVILTFNFI